MWNGGGASGSRAKNTHCIDKHHEANAGVEKVAAKYESMAKPPYTSSAPEALTLVSSARSERSSTGGYFLGVVFFFGVGLFLACFGRETP